MSNLKMIITILLVGGGTAGVMTLITKFKLGRFSGGRFDIFKKEKQKEELARVNEISGKQSPIAKKIEDDERIAPEIREKIKKIKADGNNEIKKVLETVSVADLLKKEDELWD